MTLIPALNHTSAGTAGKIAGTPAFIRQGRSWDFSRPQPYDICVGIAVAIAAVAWLR